MIYLFQGFKIDVTSGSSRYQYIINICGPIKNSEKFGIPNEVSIMQTKPNDPKFSKSLGQFSHSSLTYSDNDLQMIFDNGDVCGTRLARKTIINFKCSDSTESKVDFVYESDCHYYFEWQTRLACVRDCAVEQNGSLYDLSALTSNFWPVLNSLASSKIQSPYTHMTLNICDELKLDDSSINCSHRSSSCVFNNSTKQVLSLGTFDSDLEIVNNSLRLIYSNGDLCDPSNEKRAKTIINFICDPNAENYPLMSLPRLVSSSQCEFEVQWRTREACPKTRIISNSLCKVQSNNNGIQLDLTMLAESNNIFQTDENKYSFQICGRKIPNSELTFADKTGELVFTETPRLIYQDGNLFFNYENRTSGKKASVRLECGLEESLTSEAETSEEYAEGARVLWRSREACGGINGLSGRFEQGAECVVYEIPNSDYGSFKPVLTPLNSNLKPSHYVDIRLLLRKSNAEHNDIGIDLQPLAFSSNNVSSIKFYTRICTACSKCVKHLGCLILNEWGSNEKSIGLGSVIEQARFLNNDLILTYKNGDECRSGFNYSFEIFLKCSPGLENELSFIRKSESGCRWHFEWLSSQVCRRQFDNLPKNIGCKIRDESINHEFDFNPLKDELFSENKFNLAICRPLNKSECKNSVNWGSCEDDKSLGQANDELKFENGIITLSYTSEIECGPGVLVSTKIEFYCDYNQEKSQIRVLYSSACYRIVALYTYLACVPFRPNFNCHIEGQSTPLNGLFQSSNSLFTLRLLNYRLVFRPCALLSRNEQILPNKTFRKCFDKFGDGVTSACLYDESSAVNTVEGVMVRQLSLGLSKGPFKKIPQGYKLEFTSGDRCPSDLSMKLKLNAIFKCDPQHTSRSVELMDLSNKCEFNVQVDVPGLCEQFKTVDTSETCVYREFINEQVVRVYNLTNLSKRTMAVKGDQFNLEMKICGDMSFYESDTALRCSLKKPNENFKIIETGYRTRIQYFSSDCPLFKINQSVIIDFICDNQIKASDVQPVLKSNDENTWTIEIAAKAACPITKFIQNDKSLYTCDYYPYKGKIFIITSSIQCKQFKYR